MAFKKGQSGNLSGRPKGSKDKLNRDLKQRVLEIDESLRKLKKGLMDLAEAEPKWFYENFYKPLLPKHTELTGKDDGPIESIYEIVFVDPPEREKEPE